MSQRNPARAVNNRGGSTIRYDIVWTLPYSEYARIGQTEQLTWWIDSIHGNEIAARKRYNVIADAVAAGNGSVALLEIMADSRVNTFTQRVVYRAGNNVTPPHISKIDPVALDVDQAFKQFVAKWQARASHSRAADAPVLRVNLRPKPKPTTNYRAWAAAAVGFFLSIGALASIAGYRSPATASGGINGFGARTFGTAEAAGLPVSHERPTQMIYLPVRGDSGERVCEINRMTDKGYTVYVGKGPCPGR